MKITMSENKRSADVTHGNNEVISFNIEGFAKAYSSSNDNINSNNIFDVLNNYLSYLDSLEETKDNTTEIYDNLKIMLDVLLSSNDDINILIQRLQAISVYIVEAINIDKLEYWVNNIADINLPILPVEYNQSICGGTRETTYLKTDYRDLVVLAIATRVFVPIWGELVDVIKKTISQDKEYYCYLLLVNTKLYKYKAMVFLRNYVKLNLNRLISENYIRTVSLLSPTTIDDLPAITTALCIVRRVALKNITVDIDGKTLVTYIYSYIMQRSDPNRADHVRSKNPNAIVNDSGQERSRAEAYREKSDVPIGDLTAIKVYLSDVKNVAEHIMPGLSEHPLFNVNYQAVMQNLKDHIVTDGQLAIVQWIIQKIAPARLLKYFTNEEILKLLAVTQLYLWVNNFKEVCLILSGKIDNNSTISIYTKSQINKSDVAILDQYYKLRRLTSGSKGATRENVAVKAIEIISAEFFTSGWITTLPDVMLSEIQPDKRRRLSCPPEIRNYLSRLVIHLAQAQEKE